MRSNFKNLFIAGFALLLIPIDSSAIIKLPALFTDNMVLQQNTKVAFWGWADPNEEISIQNNWNNKIEKTKADGNGRWMLYIKTSKAGGPYHLIIKGSNTIEINNVLLGEVWLCSGQSNMEYKLEKQEGAKMGSPNAKEEIAAANYPNLRMFTVARNTSESPLDDVKGSWKVCTPQTAGSFSAVAYFFGKEIMKEIGVPVGLIHSSWGGTPVESWTNKQLLESDTAYKPIFDRYAKAVDNYNKAKSLYDQRFPAWLKDSVQLKQKGDTLKKPASIKYHVAPAQLYNAMIHPLIPYTLKGILWYQGEANASRAYQYRKLFPLLIHNWRNEWKEDLPFYFVQIAPYKDQNPEIREAQLLTYKIIPKTGIAIITDAGDSMTIHPTNKEIPGKRLAYWALAKDYGKKDIVYSGPIYKSYQAEGNKIRIRFDFAEGLIAKGEELTEFTIAGADKKFVPAKAMIDGNTIIVWSDAISEPIAVRFAWKNFMRPNLFNKAGLPASPFRTDDWPGETFGKN